MKERTIYCPAETQVLVLRSEGAICNVSSNVTNPFDGNELVF